MEGEEEDVSNCLTCPVCLNGYTHLVQDRMPLVGKCGHTICCTCVQSLGYTLDCPICRHENSFKWKSKNYQCIGMLDVLHNKNEEIKDLENTVSVAINENEILKEQIETNEKYKRICVHCNECNDILPINKSRICFTCALGVKEFDLCITINNYDEVEKLLFCGSCFLDGVHNGHRVAKYLPIKLAQSSESAIKHYHSLLIESKEEDWEEICSDVTNIEKHVTVLVKEVMAYKSTSKTWEEFKNGCEIIDELVAQAVAANDIFKKAVVLYKEEYEEITSKLTSLLPITDSV